MCSVAALSVRCCLRVLCCLLLGRKPDGSVKVRPIDDMTRSGCNAATASGEKLRYENLDVFFRGMRAMHKSVGPDLKAWKADIDSAFRRIPLLPAHRQHAHVVFIHNGNVIVAKHLSCMFGAVSSVYHWERVGELLKAIARRLFHLPVCRFVDDFFAAEHSEVAAHGMQIFARLVDLLLGEGACAPKKLECGNPLTVLGVQVELNLAGVVFTFSPEKAAEWVELIRYFIKLGLLTPGEASKLAGEFALPVPGWLGCVILPVCQVAWASHRSTCLTDWEGRL